MLPLHHDPEMLVGRMRFNQIGSMLVLLVSSGSPESRTQRYAVISRVRATGPRLPFANVVIESVGMAGLEPALSCSQGTRAAAAPHPVIQSERADLNRTIPATDPTKKARCRWDTGLSVFSRNRDGQVSQAQWIKRGIRRMIGACTRPSSLFVT